MVPHERKGVNEPPKPLGAFEQASPKGLHCSWASKNIPAIVSTVKNVIDRALELNPELSRHS